MSESPVIRFGGNLLLLGGLFLFSCYVSGPIGLLWGRYIVEGLIATGNAEGALLQLLGSAPSFGLAAILGSGVAIYVRSAHSNRWASVFGAYLAFRSYTSHHWFRPRTPFEWSVDLLEAILVGVSCLLGCIAMGTWLKRATTSAA